MNFGIPSGRGIATPLPLCFSGELSGPDRQRSFSIFFDTLNRLFHGIPQFLELGRAMLVKEFVICKQRAFSLISKIIILNFIILLFIPLQFHIDTFYNFFRILL